MSILFPVRLKEIRIEKQLMQKELAEIIDVGAPRISEWEAGKMRPIYEDLIKLALFFDVSVDYLLGLEDEYGNKINLTEIEKPVKTDA